MTEYHINPYGGDDTKSGLDWANAWQSMRALRKQSIVPVAGDHFKYAKSPAVGGYTLGTTNTVIMGLNGTTLLDTTGYGEAWQHKYYIVTSTNNPLRRLAGINYGSGGTMTYTKQPLGYRDMRLDGEMKSIANNGEFNVPNTKLVSAELYALGAAEVQKSTHLTAYIRFPDPYTGPGTQDIPAGALILKVCNANSGETLIEIPINQVIRNSTDWSRIHVAAPNGGTFSATSSASRIELVRTSMPLDRDNRMISVEMMGVEFWSSTAGPHMGSALFVMERNSTISSSFYATEEVTGTADQRVAYEFLMDDHYGNDGCITMMVPGTKRITPTVSYAVSGFLSPDLYLTGTHALSPPGSRGEFDLNGSTGGTPENPITISGGWDTSTDTATGTRDTTAMAGGHTPRYPSAYSLFDLAWADNIVIRNMAALGSYRSLFTRACNVTLDKCHLPFGLLTQAFGDTSDNTNVTLRRMFVNPFTLDRIGRMGKLVMDDATYSVMPHTGRKFPIELRGGLHMNMSHFGYACAQNGDMRASDATKRFDIWGDAILENMTLICPPVCVGREFGRTLTFRNPLPWTTSSYDTTKFIDTAPESRWDKMEYIGTAPYYYFWSYSKRVRYVSADALLIATWAASLASEYDENLGVKTFPTTMRGSASDGYFTDGAFVFTRGSSNGFGTADRHTMTYVRYSPPTGSYVWDTARNGTAGDVVVPRANHIKTYSRTTSGDSVYYTSQGYVLTEEADAMPTGRMWIIRPMDGLLYRTNAKHLLAVGTQQAYGPVCLMALYLPRAGRWRATIGFTIDLVSPMYLGPELGHRIGSSMRYALHSADMDRGSWAVDGEGIVNGGPVTIYAKYPYDVRTDNMTEADKSAWQSSSIDFETTKPCLAHILVYPKENQASTGKPSQFDGAIFDKVEINERT